MKTQYFYLSASDGMSFHKFEGYDNGMRWNGFIVPVFTKDQYNKLLDTFNTDNEEDKDTFLFLNEGIEAITIESNVYFFVQGLTFETED